MTAAPRLETARLVLRAHAVADFPAFAALWADPAVVRYIGGKPSTPEESWARLLRYGGLWPLLGFGYWAVESRSTGAFLGDVGFADFGRAMTPSIAGRPEMGWVFSPAAHGQGLAREATEAALAWLDRDAVCIIDPANAASLRLAARLGFRQIALATYRDAATLLLERPYAPGVCSAK